ncbi:slipin family protein [Flavobacterium silvaticum]|uniref:Slipin family protein n=1 Tax=Flavobacterium silvaticum TaxID=1852020 RepID=A0A972FX64_9FLAO|nr:slipin family protein [Flavobacterium silvaticum]NMH29285.1 slipin family protein [Flavobacterium silvaticum]
MLNHFNIKANKTGLVFKNGKLIRVLSSGYHWTFFGESIEIHDMTQPFYASADLNIMLRNQDLAAMLEVIEVKDGEIVLQFANGIFKEVLTAGRYAFWKGILDYTFTKADISTVFIDQQIPKYVLETVKVRAFIRKFVVASTDAGILFIDGKFEKQVVSGTYAFWANSTSVEIKTVDLRTQHLEISGQELLTKDKAGLRINFFVRFKVTDVIKALVANKEHEKQLYILMQLALRESVGALALDELLSKKETLGSEIIAIVSEKANELGVEVSDAGIRDVILPGDMKDIMNQVLVAEKKAQANIIMRREETASTRSLLNTAKLMEENTMLFKLKEMEYVEKIAEKINNISLSGSGQIVDQLKQIFVK